MAGDATTRFYRGRSMAGTLRPGDRLTVTAVAPSEVRLGDVVVFRGTNRWGEAAELVHRIVDTAPDGLVARGDSNPRADETLVTAATLVGRVTHLERDGRTRPVRGGRRGLWRGRLLHARLALWRVVKRVGGPLYRRIRATGWVRRWWRPAVTRIRVAGENGPVVKYVAGGRTVAYWWPRTARFECRRPYDLVLSRPAETDEAGAP